jgi:hypothetical protein
MFSRLWQMLSFIWGPCAAFHGMAGKGHIEGSLVILIFSIFGLNTSADVSKFQIVPVHIKCLILLKPVLGWGRACTFHYRP